MDMVGSFYNLAVVDIAATKIEVQVPLLITTFIFYWKIAQPVWGLFPPLYTFGFSSSVVLKEQSLDYMLAALGNLLNKQIRWPYYSRPPESETLGRGPKKPCGKKSSGDAHSSLRR